MTIKAQDLLDRLSDEEQSPIVRRVRALMASPDKRIVVEGSGDVSASQIEPTWRVRQKNAQARKKKLFGLPGLLTALRASPDRLIRVIRIVDERESATLFFDAITQRFIGAVVVVMSDHTRAFYAGTLPAYPMMDEMELGKVA